MRERERKYVQLHNIYYATGALTIQMYDVNCIYKLDYWIGGVDWVNVAELSLLTDAFHRFI